MDLLVEHIVQPPPWPSSVRPTLPRELDILVLAMLAKDPAARPSLSTVRANLVHLSGSLLPVGPIVRAGPEQRTFVEERILAVAPAQPARAASVRPFPAPPVTPAVTPPSSSAPSVIVAPSVQPLSPSPRPDPAPPPSPGAVPPPSAAASQSLARVMEAVPAPVSGVADRTDLIRPAMLMAEPFHREIRNGGGWRWWLAGALMVALGVALAFALR
jgi:serine/threonine-protein kinase